MDQGKLQASWDRTRGHLERAFFALSATPEAGEEGGSVSGYRDWLEHNELELALDELEVLGDANEVSSHYWEALLAAAREMQLSAHVDRYLARLAS